ncbi:MAG TPA: helix-turn-helix transcriptional regulator [Gemmatimonadales bacterium]|nr:helix-turn-helix transcriptional regulator [Gemmatimonadales bacterium]
MPATVATVLLPDERARVEAAGQDCFVALHGDSLDDAIRQVRRHPVDAVFLSVHRCDDAAFPRVAQFVREFPQVPAVALISRLDYEAPRRVLGLGASGVRAVVDVSVPAGWGRLRDLLHEPSSPVAARVMGALDRDISGVPPDCRLFFEVVVRRAPELRTVKRLAGALRVVPSSLMSRFYRFDLPSPKTYLAHARLLHAAYLFRNGGLSIADIANRLDYSSPQSFGRHLRTLLGVTAGEFRRRLPFDAALDRFRERLVTPYRDRLLAFHPLGARPGDHGQIAV